MDSKLHINYKRTFLPGAPYGWLQLVVDLLLKFNEDKCRDVSFRIALGRAICSVTFNVIKPSCGGSLQTEFNVTKRQKLDCPSVELYYMNYKVEECLRKLLKLIRRGK